MHRLKNAVILILTINVFLFADMYKNKYIQVFFPSGKQITAELALTEKEKLQGLMFRDKIHSDQGMLFVYDEEGLHSFWMKNVSFSIDILWLDAEKRIVDMVHSIPLCLEGDCPVYKPAAPALYALELKAGTALEEEFQLNDKLDFVLEKDRDSCSISVRYPIF